MRVSEMHEHHTFRFDEDKAYADQVVSILEASPEHLFYLLLRIRERQVYFLFFAVVFLLRRKDKRSSFPIE